MDLNEKNKFSRDRAIEALAAPFDAVAEQCESPIEVALVWALVELGAPSGWCLAHDMRSCGKVPWMELRGEVASICVAPQHEIKTPSGVYRVDFGIDASCSAPTVDGGVAPLVASVVVECDGHDFHERTKQQASRDRARDRQLQAMGYTVLRFTGSDIYRDAAAVATEIVDACDAKVQSLYESAWEVYSASRTGKNGGK